MLTGDRLCLLDPRHGAVTLVAARGATEEERRSALGWCAARQIVERLRCDDARRSDLVDAYEVGKRGGGSGDYRRIDSRSLAGPVLEAVRRGHVLFVLGWHRTSKYQTPIERGTLSASGPPSAPPEAHRPPTRARVPAVERRTWFEVEVTDEIGEPVGGVSLLFDVDGELREVTTAPNGVGRVDDVYERSATVRIASLATLRSKLGTRWSKPRDKDWIAPRPGSNIVEVCATGRSPVLTLDAERRAALFLHPPYRVRLHDEAGKVLAGIACTVDVGGERLELVSDGNGWVEFAVAVSFPETARIEWRDGGKRARVVDVVLQCHEGDRSELAVAMLSNHGYPVADLERAVLLFQADLGLAYEPVVGNQIPSATVDKIVSLWEDRHG